MDADRPCFLHRCVFIFPKLEDKHPEIAKNSVVPHVSLGFCKFANRGPKCDRMGDILDRNGKLATTKNFSAISRCKSARWKKKKKLCEKAWTLPFRKNIFELLAFEFWNSYELISNFFCISVNFLHILGFSTSSQTIPSLWVHGPHYSRLVIKSTKSIANCTMFDIVQVAFVANCINPYPSTKFDCAKCSSTHSTKEISVLIYFNVCIIC